MGNQLFSCCHPGQREEDQSYRRSLGNGIQPSTGPMSHACSPDTAGYSHDGCPGMEVAKSGTSLLNKPDERTLATDSSRERDHRNQPHDPTASSAKPTIGIHHSTGPMSHAASPDTGGYSYNGCLGMKVAKSGTSSLNKPDECPLATDSSREPDYRNYLHDSTASSAKPAPSDPTDNKKELKFSLKGQPPATRIGTGGVAPAAPPLAGGRTQRTAGLRSTARPRHAHPHDRQFTHQAAAAVGVRLNGHFGAKSGATCVRRGFSSKYALEGVLGKGSSATCYRCVDRQTRKQFACKVINAGNMDPKMKPLLGHYRTEIQVLKILQHPNIIHMEDAFESTSKIEMVLEIMEGGELFDYVVEKGTLSESEASVMVRKVASGLAYMHSKNIMHRDLKPENLMLATKGPNPEIKIIDFGLSKIMSSSYEEDQQFVGTKGYVSPEMLQRRPYTKAIDVWGLGVIVYVLLCGCLPFDDETSILDRAGLKKKFDLRFPKWAEDISPAAKGLLSELLVITPQARMTAEEALDHPWVAGLTAGADKFLESPRTLRQLRLKYGNMSTVGGRGGRGCEENNAANLSSAGAAAAAQEAFRRAEFKEQSAEYMKGSDRLRLGGDHPTKHCDRLRKLSI